MDQLTPHGSEDWLHYKATCNVTSLGLGTLHTIKISIYHFFCWAISLGEQVKINKIFKLHIFNIQQKACAGMVSKQFLHKTLIPFVTFKVHRSPHIF